MSDGAATKRIPSYLVIGLIVAGLSICCWGCFQVRQMLAHPGAKDVSRYSEILSDYRSDLIPHFPSHIPENATQVSFYYQPMLQQSGSYLELRYRLSLAEIANVKQQYLLPEQLQEDLDGEIIVLSGEQVDLLTFEFRNKSNTDFAALPDHFVIIVIDAEPYKPSDWNHGHSYGVALSETHQEVIYWTKEW